MNTPTVSWDVVAQALVILGTGGWLAHVIKDHGRRLADLEQAINGKASTKAVETLEKAMPNDLDARLRMIEKHKLDTTEHAKFCAMTLKNVETMVAGLKEHVDAHAARLAEGEKLFRELTALAAELKVSLRNGRNGQGTTGK
jgi:chromosome segregation ATPase